MGMTAALMTLEAVDRLERVVAIELLCACQALDCDPGTPGEGVLGLHAAVRQVVEPLTVDRPPAGDVAAILPVIASGTAAAVLAAATD
jgi:histidine ammonia-lyase